MSIDEGDNRLWQAARALGEHLGCTSRSLNWARPIPIPPRSNVPTLGGLGVVGGSHAANGHVVLGPMPERAALLALTLLLPPDVT